MWLNWRALPSVIPLDADSELVVFSLQYFTDAGADAALEWVVSRMWRELSKNPLFSTPVACTV